LDTFSSHPWMIAGPCALESREQLQQHVRKLQSVGLSMLRAPLWKPRTHPGWEGLGYEGLATLLEETLDAEMVPATEVLTPEHARALTCALEKASLNSRKKGPVIAWIGARNQNHLNQREIGAIFADNPRIFLMFKNQMWEDEGHWMGIYHHLLSSGFPSNRLIACHRGFASTSCSQSNPNGWRNLPNFEMAMRIKEKTKIPMLIDPSHIGGKATHVASICLHALEYAFDGFFIEVHECPEQARTDPLQQLSWEQFQHLLPFIYDQKKQPCCSIDSVSSETTVCL